jgi:chromosome condensin MukBEF complex kleisin-like MukF subunit
MTTAIAAEMTTEVVAVAADNAIDAVVKKTACPRINSRCVRGSSTFSRRVTDFFA